MKCINKSHPEYKELYANVNLSQPVFDTFLFKWMNENPSLDRFPNQNELNDFVNYYNNLNPDFNKNVITFFKEFGIDFKKGRSSIDLLRKTIFVDPDSADDSIITGSAKMLLQLIQASPNINFEKLIDLVEETKEFATEINKNKELKKTWQYLKEGNRIPFDEWVAYIKEYNTIKNKVLEKHFIESLVDAKTKKSKLHEFIIDFINYLKNLFNTASNLKEITDALISQVLINNKEAITGTDLNKNKEKVTLENALKETKHGSDIIHLFGKEGLTLTGSVSAAEQGSVFRKTGKLLHDIDWVVPTNYKKDPKKILYNEYPGSKMVREFDSPNYYTETFIVAPKNHRVENLTFFQPEIQGKTKYIASYDIVDNNTNKVVSNYRRYYDVKPISKKVYETAEIYNENLTNVPEELNGVAIDFFYVKNDPVNKAVTITLSTGLTLNIANWLTSFSEKLKYGRNKDLVDWLNFIPNEKTEETLYKQKNTPLPFHEAVAEFVRNYHIFTKDVPKNKRKYLNSDTYRFRSYFNIDRHFKTEEKPLGIINSAKNNSKYTNIRFEVKKDGDNYLIFIKNREKTADELAYERNQYELTKQQEKQELIFNEERDRRFEQQRKEFNKKNVSEDDLLSEQMLSEQDDTYVKRYQQLTSDNAFEIDSDLQKKIAVMQSIFNVEIIIDNTISEKGRVEQTKQGKVVVRINGQKATKDTLFHEFAHIFIDIVGGLSDSRVKRAVQLLKNTPLWEEIAKKYPELNNENLSKEVLAEAMGLEASQLFKDSPSNQTWWNRFLDWFFRTIRLKTKSNVADNVIKSLATAMMNSEYVDNIVLQNIYQQRAPKNKDFIKKTSVVSLIQRAIKSYKLKINYYENSTSSKTQKAVGKFKEKLAIIEKSIEKVNQIPDGFSKEEIEKQAEIIYLKTLKEFVENNLNDVTSIEKRIDEITDNSLIEPVLLEEIENFLSFSKDLGDYTSLFKKNEDLETVNKIDILLGKRQRLHDAKNDLSREFISRKYYQFNTVPELVAKIKYEREFKKEYAKERGISPNSIKKTPEFLELMDTYIKQELESNKQEIENEKYESLKGLLTKSVDVGGVRSFLMDAGQSKSVLIQLAKSILDKADFITQQNYMRRRKEFVDAFEKYENRAENIIERHKNFLDFDENGKPTGFLKGEYKAEFLIKLRELQVKSRQAADNFGDNSVEHLTAKKYLSNFIKTNTTEVETSKNTKVRIPNSKWRTDFDVNQLSKNDREAYEFLKNSFINSDEKVLFEHQKLQIVSDVVPTTTFIRLPSVEKSKTERLFDNGLIDVIKSAKEAYTLTKTDEEQLGIKTPEEAESYKDFINLYADPKDEQDATIPVFFRGELNPNDQSYDLFSIALLNERMTEHVHQKTKVELDLKLLQDIVADKEYIVNKNTKLALSALNDFSSDVVDKILKKSEKTSNEFKQLNSIIEHRLYGMSEIPMFLGNVSVNKVAGQISSWTAKVLLGANMFAGVTNVLNNKVQAFLESVGGDIYNMKDVFVGEKAYFKELFDGSILQDTMSLIPKSKTNLLLEFFDVLEEGGRMTHAFKDSSMYRKAMQDPSFYLSHMGEHYSQSVVMYSVLSSFKVFDRNNKPLEKEGKQLSLLDLLEVKNGQININNENVIIKNKQTSINLYQDKQPLLKLRNIIKGINADLNGQHDGRMASMAQRTIIGKMAYTFRKWIMRGIDRRYKGVMSINKQFANENQMYESEMFFSSDLNQIQEGYHVTFLRFMYNVLTSIKNKSESPILTEYEASNLKKATTEFSAVLLSIFAANLLKGLADDEDDEMIYFSAIIFRRLYTEIGVFTPSHLPVVEGLRLLKTPAASISVIEKSFNLVNSLVTGDTYKSGNRKGELKAKKYAQDLIPIWAQAKRLQNVKEQSKIYFN